MTVRVTIVLAVGLLILAVALCVVFVARQEQYVPAVMPCAVLGGECVNNTVDCPVLRNGTVLRRDGSGRCAVGQQCCAPELVPH